MNRNVMHCIIYRLRSKWGLNIDTRERTIRFQFDDERQNELMNLAPVKRLVDEFGFGKQSTFFES